MKLSYTINEAIEVTGVGRTKLYQLINSGELKARKVGRRTIIAHEDLQDWLNRIPAYTGQ